MTSEMVTGVRENLHLVLIMDYTSDNFTVNCESNPALYKQCSIQWMAGWSRDSMTTVGICVALYDLTWLFLGSTLMYTSNFSA